MKKAKSIFKCHGGKFYVCDWVISNFPEKYTEMTYLEPFCGGASILLNKEKSDIEIINDIDLEVIQIYQALRDEPKEFIRRLNRCKYSEETFEKTVKKEKSEDYLENAVNEFVIGRMSKGGLKKAFSWSNRLRGGQPEEVNTWMTTIKTLPCVSERLKEVYIFNKPALEVMKAFNLPNTLVYCDPPYLHETKVSKTVYSSEMTTDDHIELSHILNSFKGKAIISGYSSPLYNRLYKGWNTEKKKVTKENKIEIIWKNY